ncbi:glycosyltransferase [Falsiroseomonas sp. HC035]|uniref:glycosyltransferase n=1 Tax=Falsiroseomonas sp. HC035 TaxID=3390999 RepID=UPI003D320987
MTITIGIKAFNEEDNIAACLASAVAAAETVDGRVVLADCGSTDRTVAIAQNFPVRIVQLSNPALRSCGAGAQLAFQQAEGEFFYLLDGDMLIDPAFLPAALAYLQANPDVAGVGGRVEEVHVNNQEFQIRAQASIAEQHRRPGLVDRLDGGGLYRMLAIAEVGYFADSNLHGFEEFELAARLRSRGWKLARVDMRAARHYGHRQNGYSLLWRRLVSGYARAPGEVLRAAIGRRHLRFVFRHLTHIRNGMLVMGWWLLILIAVFGLDSTAAQFGLLVPLLLAPLLLLSLRRRSLELGFYSMVSWNVTAIGLIMGLLWPRRPANEPLPVNTF